MNPLQPVLEPVTAEVRHINQHQPAMSKLRNICRKNNRKQTKGRRYQVITILDTEALSLYLGGKITKNNLKFTKRKTIKHGKVL